jgi:hypothetical protein
MITTESITNYLQFQLFALYYNLILDIWYYCCNRKRLTTKSRMINFANRCVLTKNVFWLWITFYQNGRLFLLWLWRNFYFSLMFWCCYLFSFVQIKISVVLIHWMLWGPLLRHRVVINDIVVWLLKNLPWMRNWLQQTLLCDP